MSEQFEQPNPSMKLAHVLFTDIVGYSKLPIDQQSTFLRTLQENEGRIQPAAGAQSAKTDRTSPELTRL